MREIILTLAMLQPIEYREDCLLFGWARGYQLGTASGWCVKFVRWNGGSIVLEVGKWNRLIFQITVW